MESFMLPGMGSPEQASSRVVRFDNECVLIPKSSLSRSKLPVVLTKSYLLPLWKRRNHQFSDSDLEDPAGSSAQLQSSEDKRVTIKVPIPTFKRRPSGSPTQTRSIPSPIIAKSLPSCFARHTSSESASSSVKLIPVRRPSLTIYNRRQDELTVPLRDCCADCQRITEECLKEGDDWKEKFSRGARRRRSASLEYTNRPALPYTRNTNVNGAFTPFSTEGSASKDITSRFATTAAFSITVDEVDRRRRSFDFSLDDTDIIRTQQSHPSASPFASSSGSSVYPRVKPRDREASSISTASSVSSIDELLPSPETLDSRNRLRSSPIEEEDETQLFPLPRRSHSKTPSPPPSPNSNESFSSLPVASPTSPYTSPTSSKCKSSSSDENILRDSSTSEVEHEHLTAPTVSMANTWKMNGASTNSPSPSPSLSLEIPTMKAPTTLVSHKPSDTKTTAIPSISPSANNTLYEISDENTPPPLLAPPSSNLSSSSIDNINSISIPSFKPKLESSVTNHKPKSPPPPPPPPSAISNHHHHTPSRKRKISFTLPFIKAGGAIRDVGADVLRGVSSISGSGLVGSV